MVEGIATFRTRRQRGFTRGELLAVLAGVSLLVAAVAPMLAPASWRADRGDKLARCQENLQRLSAVFYMYAQDNGGAFPMTRSVDGPHGDVVRGVMPRYVSDGRLFYCPAEMNKQRGYSAGNVAAGRIGYFYYGAESASTNGELSRFLLTGVSWPRRLNTKLDANLWVMSDIWLSGEPTAHAEYRKGVNYMMLDGSVDFVAESPRQAFH